jgi:uncharacterized protein involved in outer membrane biogenesis
LIAAGVGAYLVRDEAFLKSLVRERAQKHTGRELVVSGPLRITLGRVTSLEAGDISLSNASWAKEPEMARIGHLKFSINLPSLFGDGKSVIPLIEIDGCEISLSRNENGEANWALIAETAEGPETDTTGFPVRLDDLSISNCQMTLDTPDRPQPLDINAQKIALVRGADENVKGTIDGTINAVKIKASGWLKPAGAFLDGRPLEHELELEYGDVSLTSSGSFADARKLSGANVKTRFRGPSIDRVIAILQLPPFSAGAFDFRLDLDTTGSMTQINVEGDLGSLEITAKGELDKLREPSKGGVTGIVRGPDLKAIGEVLGVEGLLAEPYTLDAEAKFDGPSIRISRARLETAGDQLDVSGTVTARENLPGSQLNISLRSSEAGRWGELAGLPAKPVGALSLDGKATTDAAGVLAIDAQARFLDSDLAASGNIGPLTGPYEPDLTLRLHSDDPRALMKLAGRERFPAAPATLESRVKWLKNELHLENLLLDLAGNRLEVDGKLDLQNKFTGSDLDVVLKSPNLRSLGMLFNKADLPEQPLHIKGNLKPEGKGLSFIVEDSSLGDIRLKLNGRIADLDKPLGIDAAFNLQLPSLDTLSFLAPDLTLPPGTVRASGQLENASGQTRLQGVNLSVGDIQTSISGVLHHDDRFDLKVDISGPDVSLLHPLLGQELGVEPFSISGELAGGPGAFTIDSLAAKWGQSDIRGDLKFVLGEPLSISGKLYSPLLDVSKWRKPANDEKTESTSSSSQFVFNDTPIMLPDDYGVDAQLQINIDELKLATAHISEIDLDMMLKKHYLELKRFHVRGAGSGEFLGRGTLDGRQDPPVLDIDLKATNLRTGLGAGVGEDISTRPPGNFNIRIKGKGRTQRQMAQTLNGKVRLNFGPGLVLSSYVDLFLNDFLTQLLNTLNPFMASEEYTQLECIVAAADIHDGQVTVSPVVVNSQQVTILSQGSINLDNEEIDLSFNSKPRKGLGLSASALINPFIKVGGTLKKPVIELDPAKGAVSGGLAIATVGISVLAKTVSDRFLSSKDPCGDALAEIKERDATQP